ncbi:MAG: transcriptional regulator GcvA [Boseongicola sp.]|nr:transcriptional regulator GcvA [Boseongicola sp.]
MSDALPPLTALRAFDAAARHMSFAKAADELNVTPAALSFQIKSLEDHLGVPLFRRLNRAVELTDAGRALAPGAADAFATLQSAWRATRRLHDHSVLNVTAGPGITSLWLAPRLYSFASEHPEIDLRFSASLRVVDLSRDEVDIAIRYGYGDDDGLFRHTLMSEYMTPMMTPDLASQISSPEDLMKMPLLRDELTTRISEFATWETWFKAQGLTPPEITGPRFNQADHAVGAALAGVGVLLGRISLSEGPLRDGRLVAPFDVIIETGAAYRLLCVEGNETLPHVSAFIDWIAKETEGIAKLSDGRKIVSADDARAISNG